MGRHLSGRSPRCWPRDALDGLLQFLGVLVVGRIGRGAVAVERELPALDQRRFALCGFDRRSDVVDGDAVEIVGDAMEVLAGGPEQRPHAIVVFEIDVFVDARGDLDHPVEKRAFGGAAAVVVPLVLKTVVGFVVRAVVEQSNPVFDGATERGVFPPAVGLPPAGWVAERRGDARIAGVIVHTAVLRPMDKGVAAGENRRVKQDRRGSAGRVRG